MAHRHEMSVNFAPGGPFATLTLVLAILAGLLVSAAAAAMIVVIASLFAAGVLLTHGLMHGMRRRSGSSGPDDAPWSIETPAAAFATPWAALHAYLEHRYASTVVLTFEQIESLVGMSLPAAATTECAWWTPQVEQIDDHTRTWTATGRIATPNLRARTVAFIRPS